jgi:UDPglucose 6-dehydrogenase
MIGFAGLSHLGISYSLATASKGFDVIAFDPSHELVANLVKGKLHLEEPGLRELFEANHQRTRYTCDAHDLSVCELVFVTLDVKTDEGNRSDTAPLLSLVGQIAPHIAKGATLVVLSQVNPGFTRRLRGELLGSCAAAEIYYQVETLIFGRAVERALHPERYMVGAADPDRPLTESFRRWHESFGCLVLLMGYESAELAKVAINFFLVSSVSTTNLLAEVCETIGANWSEIAPALRLDKRIGPHAYLNPGLGIAGGNLERDMVTVKRLAEGSEVDTGMVDAWIQNSLHRRDWLSRTLQRAFRMRGVPAGSATVAIWGLAYKENTDSIKNSPSLAFISSIPDCHKQAFDPAAKLSLGSFPKFERRSSAIECCQGADALVIPTPWPEFRQVDVKAVRAIMSGRIILDPFGMLDGEIATAIGFDYYRLGTAPRYAAPGDTRA